MKELENITFCLFAYLVSTPFSKGRLFLTLLAFSLSSVDFNSFLKGEELRIVLSPLLRDTVSVYWPIFALEWDLWEFDDKMLTLQNLIMVKFLWIRRVWYSIHVVPFEKPECDIRRSQSKEIHLGENILSSIQNPVRIKCGHWRPC